jgi:hypothetical protein
MSPDAIELAKSFPSLAFRHAEKVALCVILHSLHFKVSHSTSLQQWHCGWNGRKFRTFECDRNPFKVMSCAESAALLAQWRTRSSKQWDPLASVFLKNRSARAGIRTANFLAGSRSQITPRCLLTRKTHRRFCRLSIRRHSLHETKTPRSFAYLRDVNGPIVTVCNPNFKPCRALQ